MEKSEFSPGVSRTLMSATKQLVNDRTEEARKSLLHKEDVENVGVTLMVNHQPRRTNRH
jgi:hypothetical protein